MSTSPAPKIVTEAPYFRTALPSSYNAVKALSGGPDRLVPVCRGTWKYPQVVTIYSTMTPLVDTDPARAAQNVYTFGRVRLKVTFGDGNVQFKRDVPVGMPLEVIGSVIDVQAYMTRGNIYLGGIAGDVSVWPATVKTSVTVAMVEGRNDERSGDMLSTDYAEVSTVLPFGQVGGIGEGPNFFIGFESGSLSPGPILVDSLIGYQESGTDLYVQFFDYSPFCCIYPNPDMTLVDLMAPLYEFKVKDGEDFSLNLERGILFQHGVTPLFSTTQGILTRTDPRLFNYRANWRYRVADAFAGPGFTV